jgi:molybdopterin converting factor small subunit
LPGKVKVLYFAQAREVTGKAAEYFFLDLPTSAGGLLGRVMESHPDLIPLKSTLRISVNRVLVEEGVRISDGDEVGILPPVAGG